MTGVQGYQPRVVILLDPRFGCRERHDVIADAVKDERGLAAGRIAGMVGRIVEQIDREPAHVASGVMIDLGVAAGAPLGYLVRAEGLGPASREAERGGEQHHSFDLRVRGGVQRREIAPHAGTHENGGLLVEQASDEIQLTGDGEVLEVTLVEGRNFEGNAGRLEFLAKELGLARKGSGGKAVKVEIAHRSAG